VAHKAERQHLLRRLVDEGDLGSHAEVVDACAAQGVRVHPATVSRDLREIGAVKLRAADGRLVYRLSAAPGPDAARGRLDEVLRQFVLRVESSGNLAVLRTPPACAHPVASAIDLAELDHVVATVSGDDTVLVVAEEGHRGAELAGALAVRARVALGAP